jgi:hypothetical protein
MMVLVALLIAVVAISLMMTVLVASARPLRGYDEPVFGARTMSSGQTFGRNPNWTDLTGTGRPVDSNRRSLPIAQYASTLPVGAPSASGGFGPQAFSKKSDPGRALSAPRNSGRINPNTWGRIRAEVGVLEARRQRAM